MFSKKSITYLIFIFSIFFNGLCFSNSNTNLYFTSVLVSNYDTELKNEAFFQGLEEILVRVSANEMAKDNELISEMLKRKVNISSLVYDHHYRVVGNNLYLDIQFDEGKIKKLLSDADLRVIGDNRPITMLWLAYEDLNGSKIINSGHQPLIDEKLSNVASKYKISVMLPMYDLEDQQQVNVDDILNFNFEKLSFNSKNKYGAGLILAGNYYKFEDKLHFKWKLKSKNQVVSWDSNSNALDEELDKIVEHIAKFLLGSEQCKISKEHSGENTLDIFVMGINSIDKYTSVEEYLRKLMLVKNVELKELSSGEAIFTLKTDSSREDIINALKLDKVLVEHFSSYDVTFSSDTNIDISNKTLIYKVNL